MNKTKLKIILFLILSVIALIIGFFFSGYINLLLTGGSLDDLSALYPATILESLAQSERHRILALCVSIVFVSGIAVLMLMNRRETFESDTRAIAGNIQTPIAIGQGQHGTARWLKDSERKQAFAVYRLDESNPTFAALLNAGARDRLVVSQKSSRRSPCGPADCDTQKTPIQHEKDVIDYDTKNSTFAANPMPQTPETKTTGTRQ